MDDELLHLPHDYVLDPWRGFAVLKGLVEEGLLPYSKEEGADSHSGSSMRSLEVLLTS